MGLYCCRRERAVCINHLATTTDGSNNNNNNDNDNVLVLLLQQRNTSRSCVCVRGLNEIGPCGLPVDSPIYASCVCVCVCDAVKNTASGQRILTKGRIARHLSAPLDLSPRSKGALSPWRAVPCRQDCSPVLLRRLLPTRSNVFQWGEQPAKLPHPFGGSGPHVVRDFLGPPESRSQTACRSLQSFLPRDAMHPRY